MTATTIRKFRWFWAWDDEKEENWLREMSNQGMHLQNVGFPGFYTFLEGEKKDLVYRLDFNPNIKKNDDYFNLFRDAGWFYLGEMNSWQYFRKEVTSSETPEIYTDNESKMTKYRRLIGLVAAFIPLISINIINSEKISYHPAMRFATIANVFLLIFMVIGLMRLFLRIRALKRI
jgi:hypothetical protein